MILSKSQLAEQTSNLNESFQKSQRFFSASAHPSVFLSHKHSDSSQLLKIKTLLENLNISVYVDWLDENMPKKTRGETGVMIKEKIKKYDKFILVATDAAIESKWCNWELGLGDAEKYDADKIALFPLRESDFRDWTGSEYMGIYPIIEYQDGNEKYRGGGGIPKGYYVMYPSKNGGRRLMILEEWLNK